VASTRSSRVTVYSAAGCHLCERAVEVVAEVCGVLEARYRTRIPVVEVDGEVAFTYFVRPDALRERLRRA